MPHRLKLGMLFRQLIIALALGAAGLAAPGGSTGIQNDGCGAVIKLSGEIARTSSLTGGIWMRVSGGHSRVIGRVIRLRITRTTRIYTTTIGSSTVGDHVRRGDPAAGVARVICREQQPIFQAVWVALILD